MTDEYFFIPHNWRFIKPQLWGRLQSWASGLKLSRAFVILISIVCLPSAIASETLIVQGGYSTTPLDVSVFDLASVVVQATDFNNWLNENIDQLTDETWKGAREHLYYLIDSYVSTIFARDRVVLPARPDGILSMLFSWADRLGVFGGGIIYDKVKDARRPEVPIRLSVPNEFELALDGDMLEVASKAGHWTVRFPYYFMVWMMTEFVATDGPKTQAIAISTSAARHANNDGHSQATLMLLYGPGVNDKSFLSYWLDKYGFTGNEPAQDLGVRALTTRSRYDRKTDMFSEYTQWSSNGGQFLVMYMGVDGPYQLNRINYVDFLRAIRSQ